MNLIDGSARGTVFLYRYGDVFFCGCTPELLLRKKGTHVESMCLAGHVPARRNAGRAEGLGGRLLGSEKNRREHEYVVKIHGAKCSPPIAITLIFLQRRRSRC